MTSPLCISIPPSHAYGAAPRASVACIPHPAATPTYRIAQPPSIYPLAFPASHHLASFPHPSSIFIPPSACPLHQRGDAHRLYTQHIYIHMHTHTPASAHGHPSLSTPFSFLSSPSCVPLSWISFTHSPQSPFTPVSISWVVDHRSWPPSFGPFSSHRRRRIVVALPLCCPKLYAIIVKPKAEAFYPCLREGTAVNMFKLLSYLPCGHYGYVSV